MAVGFQVRHDWYTIGSGDFLYSFFSTVAYRLEGGDWGSRFPVIMKKLYQGGIDTEDIEAAMRELSQIEGELKKFAPCEVVWDIEDLSKQPPWGDDISGQITDLSNYFVTSTGNDFLTVFHGALDKATECTVGIKIIAL